MKKIELLAPAKNLESGILAIKCGADAVYIGANRFGARTNVGNSLNDIKELIDFAHKYRAKVYVTINTLLKDEELTEAEALINALYKLGADAIIIQDMGILELNIPPIPLFASTQAHNHTPERVKFLEKVGFQRVILARELSLDQIKEIRAKTNAELETFVHGALCVSYSGQCYMSYAVGKRSGNRGECAQPCRKLYTLKDTSGKVIAENKYLLSLKDLNLSNYLKDLIDAGVTSFKIEGRLKDENYIKNVVTYYRQKLDEILEEGQRDSSGKVFTDFEPDLNKTFNRGYTDYFLNGRIEGIASFDSPKHIGEPVGKVAFAGKKFFTLDSGAKLNNGDGITFFDYSGELQGTVVNGMEGDKIFPNTMKGIKKGSMIYRNLDHTFIKELKSARIERKIGVKTVLTEENSELILTMTDEDGISAQNNLKADFDPAQKPETAISNIKKQLEKLGETDFYPQETVINTKNTYFIPSSILNDFRRKTAEKLVQNRTKTYKNDSFQITPNDFPYPEKTLNHTGNVLNERAEEFYTRHGVEKIEPAAESGIDMRGKKVMTTKHCLRCEFDMCSKKTKRPAEKLYLTGGQDNYTLEFDCKNCKMTIHCQP